MRLARKLVVLALTVSAFMAVNASMASAVTVVNESTGTTCSAVTEVNGGTPEISGGCPLRGHSVGHFELCGFFCFVEIDCEITLEGRASGAGHLVGTYSIDAPGCETGEAEPCTIHAERHAEANTTGALVNGSAPIEANFCVDAEDPDLGELECHVAGTLVQTAHSQRLVFSHNNLCEGTSNSINGTIQVEPDGTHAPVEVRP